MENSMLYESYFTVSIKGKFVFRSDKFSVADQDKARFAAMLVAHSLPGAEVALMKQDATLHYEKVTS
jgi:hypothetical protein